MSTPKGYTSTEKLERTTAQFGTMSPAGEHKYSLDVCDKAPVFVSDSDTAEAGSTNSIVVASSHTALKGDKIRFTSGAFDGQEFDVSAVEADEITLGQDLPSDVSAGDTFNILRSVSPTYGKDGGLLVQQGAVSFMRDTVLTEVNEDTGTPANNVPLPVKLTSVTGDINITANDLNVQTQHDSANPDSMQIGDGVEIMQVSASGEAQVADDTARTTLSSIDGKVATETTLGTRASEATLATRASEATLATLDGKVTACDTGNVTVVSSALPTGASTEATLATRASEATLSTLDGKVTACDTGNVTVAASALPTGASTEAKQDTGNASLASVDGKITACDTGNVTVASSALPTGAATEAKQDTGNTSLATIAGWDTNAGAVGATTQRVHLSDESLAALEDISVEVGTLDVVEKVFSSAAIPGNASLPLQLVASLGSAVKKIQVADTHGAFYELMTGASSSEVTKLYIGPGSDQTIEVDLPATTRVSIRRVDDAASISGGGLMINFLG